MMDVMHDNWLESLLELDRRNYSGVRNKHVEVFSTYVKGIAKCRVCWSRIDHQELHDFVNKNESMKASRYFDRLRTNLLASRVVFGFIGIGVVLRMAQYALNRSLWLDETMLALNITQRSFIELTQPLSYNQGAPIGFLFMQKFLTQVLGNSDFVLRLLPFVAGVASILVMYKVASVFLEPAGVLVTVGLFAITDKLVYYASEAKQYSSDVLIALLLLFIAYKCLETKTAPGNYIALIVSGVVSMWVSHPASFILVGVGFCLALDLFSRPDRHRLAWLGSTFLIWMINFVILYFVYLRTLAANPALIDYWRDAFMPMPPWRGVSWFLHSFLTMFTNPVGLVGLITAPIGMIVFLVGCISVFLRKWQLALILIVPFPTILLASGLEKYPFGERLLLFLVPIVLLLIGEGTERIRSLVSNISSWASSGVYLTIVVVLFSGPTSLATQNLWNPNRGEDIKPVISYIRQHKLDIDFIYVYYGASSAFTYYAPIYGFGQQDYYIGTESRQKPAKYIRELDKLKSKGRVWIVFSHNCSWCDVDEEKFFLEHLDEIGSRMDEFRSFLASAYLYSFDSVDR